MVKEGTQAAEVKFTGAPRDVKKMMSEPATS